MAPSTTNSREEDGGETAVRARILDAAFAAFMKNGYAATSTLEIATRARVSKREIYATVGNKQEMLIACISERARRLRVAATLPVPDDRETLARVLVSFGARLLTEISDPAVIAVFRLAIAEAVHEGDAIRYAPAAELRERLDALAHWYTVDLVTITQLIHSRIDRRAQQFADAFRIRKE